MVARARAGCEPGAWRRPPSSRSRAVHPTGRALGDSSRSTGARVAQARQTAREAESWHATTFDRWSLPQIAGCLPPAIWLQMATSRKWEGFAISHRSDRFPHLHGAPDMPKPAPTPRHTMPTSARLALARGQPLEPAQKAHSRVVSPPPARLSSPLDLVPPPPRCTCRLSPAPISPLASPSQWPSGGARKGEAVRIRRVGRSPQWLR